MSIAIVAGVAVTVLAAGYFMRSVGKASPEQAQTLVSQGALLVDVRSPGEYADGHIEGAVNIPVGEVESRIGEFGDKDASVVVYCRSGMRSASAKRTLIEHGWTDVHDLGAMSRWP